MKRWLIVYGLPLEVWVDIFSFPWITRQEFGRIVARIGNFKFAEHSQFFLHEWGHRTLSGVHFYKNEFYKYLNYEASTNRRLHLTVPQTPLPNNIKSFDYIKIRHFDAHTMEFLGQVRPLLANVRIEAVAECSSFLPIPSMDNLQTVLTNLAPFLNKIDKLICSRLTISVATQCFGNKSTKLQYYPDDSDEQQQPIMNWLTQEDNDGPRLCDVHLLFRVMDSGFCKQISAAIRQEFLTAKIPCTFAVRLILYGQTLQFAEFHQHNSIDEELHGEWTEDGQVFQITRHHANTNKEQLQQWINADAEEKYGQIRIYNPTIGPLDAAQVNMPPVDQAQDDNQQPCSSKDA